MSEDTRGDTRMTKRKKMRKKLVVLVALAMCSAGMGTKCTQSVNGSLDVVQQIATVANTPSSDATQEVDATEAPLDDEYIEDENILESTYYSYGNGCLFVSIEKEIEQSATATDETETASNAAIQEDTTTGAAVVTGMENTGIVSSRELVKACFTEEEQRALINGENKEIRVVIHNKDANRMKEKTLASMDEAVESYTEEMEGFTFGDYISISVKKKNEEGKWEKIEKFNSDLKFYLDVPKDMQIGTGTYYLVSVNDGKKDLLEDNADNYSNILTFSINQSAVYGLACVIPVEEEEDVTEPVVEQSALSSFWDKLNNEKFCLWHWFDISVLIIGITWIAAINSKKIRTIFFGIMCVISIALAIIGHCEFDWPFAIGIILIMFAVYLWRWYCQRKEEQGF